MDYRHLRIHRAGEGSGLIAAALEYAQALWMAGSPARSILALTRALYAAPPHTENAPYPVPYAALAWICRTHGGSGAGFLGNPRISFQHQAQRMRREPLERRRARAWAAWYLAAQALPKLPDDDRAKTELPSCGKIAEALQANSSMAEAVLWFEVAARQVQAS
ncbi:MAG: hypothetical protein JJT96_13295 [Opitutales bacterium]|nr:hypothetical protein [Opitutales bacterium]